jgi:hypothetical protein
MSAARGFYFTCPNIPSASMLCEPCDGCQLVTQECLMCGQPHLIDTQTGTVVSSSNDAPVEALVPAA